MILIRFVAFLLMFQSMAHAQGNEPSGSSRSARISLSGTIRDLETGEPLAGASVFFANEKIGTVANSLGKYSLNNIPDGHHVIEISHSGYGTVVEHIEIHENAVKDFSLSTVITENQAVIITGVSGATSRRKSPVPVTVLRSRDMLEAPSTNLIDALTRIPGVSQISTGPAISKPVIRGLGFNRVVTINDGARQEGQQWGDEHGIEIDELSISRVEVLKGPASLMYGSDALAGVVNFITNTPVAEGVTRGNILSNYQSNNRLMSFHGSLAGNRNGLSWNAYGSYKSAGDYRNKYDGRVLNSRFNENNFGGYIGINKSWGYSHLILSRFDQEVGLIEGDRDDATGDFLLFAGTPLERIATNADLKGRQPFVSNQRVQHNKIIIDNNFVIGKSRLKVNVGFQDNLRQEFGNAEEPDEKELFFDLKTINYNVQWQLPEMNEWHTTIGINGMQQSNKNKGEEVLIPEYRLFDIGSFIYAQRFFNDWTVSGGLRFDHRSLRSDELAGKFTGFTRNFSNVSGSVGLSYEPVDFVTVKANIARGFRAPTIAELASNGTHEGTNRYEYGDVDLGSEKSLQLDGGLELDYEHFSFTLSAFYNRINDFIFYNRLRSVGGGDSLVNVDGEDIQAFQFNQQDARLSGLELMLDIHPHPLDWLHLENRFSFVRGRFDTKMDGDRKGSDNLPLIPAARWVGELRGDIKKWGKVLREVYFSLEADKTFEQGKAFTGFDTETSTPGYFLLNSGVGAGIYRKDKMVFSVHLAVHNITDAAYQQHLSRLKYTAQNLATGRTGVFNSGRNFSIKLNVPFNFSKN